MYRVWTVWTTVACNFFYCFFDNLIEIAVLISKKTLLVSEYT